VLLGCFGAYFSNGTPLPGEDARGNMLVALNLPKLGTSAWPLSSQAAWRNPRHYAPVSPLQAAVLVQIVLAAMRIDWWGAIALRLLGLWPQTHRRRWDVPDIADDSRPRQGRTGELDAQHLRDAAVFHCGANLSGRGRTTMKTGTIETE